MPWGFAHCPAGLYRELAAWLLPTALATDHGPTLSEQVIIDGSGRPLTL